jgi:hypothetical protein
MNTKKTMKRLHIYSILALTFLLALTACQQDDEDNKGGGAKGSALVTLRIGTGDGYSDTRADGSSYGNWKDSKNALSDRSEMMYSWVVIITNSSGQVVYQKAKTINDSEKNDAEIDEVTDDPIELAADTYTAYSFANIGVSWLKATLGDFTAANATLDASTVEDAVANVNGNLFSPIGADDNIANATTNSLGGKGIPMSNKQTLIVDGTGTAANPEVKDLIVVRMLAKLEFRFFNATGRAVHVKSITISDITKSVDGYIKLLPQYTTPANANDMEYHHQDLQPNLNTSATGFGREDVKYVFRNNGGTASPLAIPESATYDYELLNNANYAYQCSFYVNESTTPANDDQLFFLTLELGQNNNKVDYRYALVTTGVKSGLPTNGNDVTSVTPTEERWDYIARNDYRVIPVIIDDYKLEIIPYDFPAIGVYPASVKTLDESKNLYEVLFHDYGHFHLVPFVYKGESLDDPNATIITYSPTQGDHTSTVWSLMDAEGSLNNTQWQKIFKSFKDDAITVLDADANSTLKFYGQPGASGLPGDNTYPSPLPDYGKYFDAEVTHTKTIDEEIITYSQGDFPMLDTETKWDPKGGNNYHPYIFGQIAPQEDYADKKTYHELRAYVYVNGESVPRQLVYRFFMHLQQDFGLDPVVTPSGSRLRSARPSCGCHHGL